MYLAPSSLGIRSQPPTLAPTSCVPPQLSGGRQWGERPDGRALWPPSVHILLSSKFLWCEATSTRYSEQM